MKYDRSYDLRFMTYTKYLATFFVLILGMLGVLNASEPVFVFETDFLKYTLSSDGKIAGFIDKRDGHDLLDRNDTYFCTLQIERDSSENFAEHAAHSGFDVHGGQSRTALYSSRIEKKDGQYTVYFSDGQKESNVRVVFNIESKNDYLLFRIVRIDGNFFSLEFARSFLKQDEEGTDPFIGTGMNRTLNVTTREYPGQNRQIGGFVYSKFGYDEAALAVFGLPESRLRDAMKKFAAGIDKGTLPIHRSGGPFALDDPRTRGNYIITSIPIHPDAVEAWSQHLSRFGVNQIYFHQGGAFRQGDFIFNSTIYPNGISDFREVSRRFNKNGIITGILTYAHFVALGSKFVTPIPHKDLAQLRSMTLTADLDEKQTSIPILESTADMTTVTGFNVVNSVILRIDDELIIFKEVNKQSPFGFTQCERGALGTVAASHKKGSKVGHIAQKYGMLCSRPGSDLVREIAAETAHAYNEGGFDMIYLDAMDGTSVTTECQEYIPYYDAFFINEILKGVKSVPLMDYCFSWYPISRIGEWDSGRRGYQRFFDLHIKALEPLANRRYLPGHLGWIALCPSAADNMSMLQCPPMFPEDVHYLGTKTVAWNYGLSYLDVSLNNTLPLAFRNGEILEKYCRFQKVHKMSKEDLKRLQVPGAHFVLETSDSEAKNWYFRKALYEKISVDFPVTDKKLESTFSVTNGFQAQTPSIRIENRYTAGLPVKGEAIELVPIDETQRPENIITRKFDPPIDLRKHVALGLWVYGDGKGQKINVRVESPIQYVSGHNDHFIDVDFTGWRYFTLIESDNGTREPMPWPKSCGSYIDEHRELVHYEHISEVNVMTIGDTSGLRFRTLNALPVVVYDMTDPTIILGDKKIVFQGRIPSGHYMEWNGGSIAFVYDNTGKETGQLNVQGGLQLATGKNTISIQCSGGVKLPLHAKVVFGFKGPKL